MPKVTELPLAATLTGTELVPVVQDGVARRAPVSGFRSGLTRYAVRTGSYTATAADHDVVQVFTSDSAVTLSVPPDLPKGTYIPFIQWGAGQVTVASTPTGGTVAVRDSKLYVQSSASLSLTHPVGVPAGTVAGDGLLFHLAFASLGNLPATPTDLTLLGSVVGPSGAGSMLFKKQAAVAADAGSTKGFTFGTGIPLTAVCIALSGINPTDFIDGLALLSQTSAQSSGSRTSPTITTVADRVLELSLRSSSTGTTQAVASTVPDGMSLLTGSDGSVSSGATASADANSQIGLSQAPTLVPAGTGIGNRTWNGGSGYGITRVVGVRPATVPATKLRSAGNAFKTVGQGADGGLLVLDDGVHVSGYLVA